MFIIPKDKLLKAIFALLKQQAKSWQLVSIYNDLMQGTIVEINETTGEIECDEESYAEEILEESYAAEILYDDEDEE